MAFSQDAGGVETEEEIEAESHWIQPEVVILHTIWTIQNKIDLLSSPDVEFFLPGVRVCANIKSIEEGIVDLSLLPVLRD